MDMLWYLRGIVLQGIVFVPAVRLFWSCFSLYRQFNRHVSEPLQLVRPVDWLAGVKVQLHTDEETYRSMGKEHALVVSNHQSDIDWLIGWILAQRSGCLGSTLAVLKKSSKFLPQVIGWSMWFAEYLFLERSWAQDEKTLKWGLQRLKDLPRPFWLALFVEGTRFTPTKLLAAPEYAASQGLPDPRNVLIPRTKGFVPAVSIMRDFDPAIYDTTVIIPKDSPRPTMLRILKGQSSVVHVRIKRRVMSELPKSDEDVLKWSKCTIEKDALLYKLLATRTYYKYALQWWKYGGKNVFMVKRNNRMVRVTLHFLMAMLKLLCVAFLIVSCPLAALADTLHVERSGRVVSEHAPSGGEGPAVSIVVYSKMLLTSTPPDLNRPHQMSEHTKILVEKIFASASGSIIFLAVISVTLCLHFRKKASAPQQATFVVNTNAPGQVSISLTVTNTKEDDGSAKNGVEETFDTVLDVVQALV